jgi:phage terminase large subunit GpA-like protein
MESAEQAFMPCPHCGQIYTHDGGKDSPGKAEMNDKHSKWIKDGCNWMENGTVAGSPIRSNIASFWLKGPAAEFTDWKGLVLKYLQALDTLDRTGDSNPLKTTVNTDQGLPFTPVNISGSRLPEDLKNRAIEVAEKEVPEGVRFLVASIDVQKNRFVVQVHGFGEGGDLWVIDRFDIRKSNRKDDDGERYWVSPGSYLEDWKLITSEVIDKTYALDDGSGRHMRIKLTLCDSGGREGVTAKAYDYWRFLKKEGGDLHRRFLLVKGDSEKNAARVRISYPDSERKDRKAGARGEVPVALINSNQVKDQVDKMLDRESVGGGRVNFPSWLDDSFYTELTVENRTAKGWENPKKHRNEAWDLLCYAVVGTLTPLIMIEHINWNTPPKWAAEWDKNDLVSTAEKARFTPAKKAAYDFSKLGDELN